MAERRLRVLHVATLVTPDGAYGGPIRVAVNQVNALRERGHDAMLVAGAAGFDALPDTWDGAPVRLFRTIRAVPGFGFAGTFAPGMRRWIRRQSVGVDVAHVHLARDLVTLPAALEWMRAEKPFVTQTHGMVLPSTHRLAGPLDAMVTRRVLARAGAAYYLNEGERDGLLQITEGALHPQALGNGIPVPKVAAGPPPRHEVLFLARLHADKRPLSFLDSAVELAPEFPDTRFTLVGPDGGEGPRVTAAIRTLPDDIRKHVTWEGGVTPDAVLARIARASIYVLPSRRESFGMSALEAMAAARPVIVTEGCSIAPAIRSAGAGVVIQGPQDLTDALRRLLRQEDERTEMGRRGARLAKERFSMDAVVAKLVRTYGLLAESSSRRARTVHDGTKSSP